ncbi:cytochrome P450 family protein [Abortiporus biennis]
MVSSPSSHSFFKLLKNTVIAVSGDAGRKDFFTAKGLDINEGFKVLSGAIPMLPGVTSDLQARRITLIHKRLSAIQNSEHLSKLLPKIVGDADRVIRSWQSGTLDPFDVIPKLCFQTTVRSLACSELADDENIVARLKKLYDNLDSSTTPASVLFPWFPSPSLISKLYSTKKIYDIVNRVIDQRIQSGIPQDDTLQMLVDNADDKLVILGFIMGLLVAGARSTGVTASWLITFLGTHPHWKNQAYEEVREVLSSAYSDSDSDPKFTSSGFMTSKSATTASALSTIPIDVWENKMPVLDSLIRETLRIAQPHTAMRRNMGPDTFISGARVPSGAYVVYPFSDVHLNPELYPDPYRFDPGRPKHEMPFAYVGWGAGTTICLGQRLARLQLKIMMSLMLLDTDFLIVDKTGSIPNPLPSPNWNDALTCRPPRDSCLLRFSRTEEDHQKYSPKASC